MATAIRVMAMVVGAVPMVVTVAIPVMVAGAVPMVVVLAGVVLAMVVLAMVRQQHQPLNPASRPTGKWAHAYARGPVFLKLNYKSAAL